MKKKLLLALAIVAIMTCLFAISVSAAVTTYDDVPTGKFTASTDDLVVFDDGFSCPSAYVTTNNTSLTFNFDYIAEKTGTTYTVANIVEFDIPEGVTWVGQNFKSSTAIKRVSFPKSVAEITGSAFTGCTVLKSVDFENEGTDIKFGSDIFKNVDSLQTATFRKNSGITSLGVFMFNDCDGLEYLSIPDSVKTLKIGALNHCGNLGPVYLPKSLTTIEQAINGGSMFEYCNNVYFVNEFFTDPTKVEKPEVYCFPNVLTTIPSGEELFKSCKALNDILVFGDKLVSIEDSFCFNGTGAKTLVFLGDIQGLSTVNGMSWTKQAAIYFCNKNDVDMNSFTSNNQNGLASKFVFCNAADNTTHLYKVETETAPTCTVDGVKGYTCFCGKPSSDSEVIKADGHTASDVIKNKYFKKNEDGSINYFANMVKVCDCTACDATDVEFDYEGTALFATDKGYSFSETDASSISYTLHVNLKAMKEYLAENADFKYGIVVSANPSESPISYANGAISPAAKTLVFEMQGTEYMYEYVMAKLTLDTDYQDKSLNCQAYAIENNTITYVGQNSVSAKAEVISHKILVDNYKSKEDLATPAA